MKLEGVGGYFAVVCQENKKKKKGESTRTPVSS